jgi:hypothetical protein
MSVQAALAVVGVVEDANAVKISLDAERRRKANLARRTSRQTMV